MYKIFLQPRKVCDVIQYKVLQEQTLMSSGPHKKETNTEARRFFWAWRAIFIEVNVASNSYSTSMVILLIALQS